MTAAASGGAASRGRARPDAVAGRATRSAKARPEEAAPRPRRPARAMGPAAPGSAGARAPGRAAPASPAPPPRPARPSEGRAPKVAPALLDRLVEAARRSLEDDKAEDVVVLDVTGRADYADRLIIATGLADRQLRAMAQHLEEALAKAGLSLTRDRIQSSPDWVLIDAGDLVVHLFRPETRAFYALEKMWGPGSPEAEAAAPPPAGTEHGGDGSAGV